MRNFYVASDGLLGVCSNVNDFKWSYGMNMPPATREEYERCELRFRLEVGGGQIFDPKTVTDAGDSVGKYHYFSGVHGEDRLYYQRTFLFDSLLQIEVSGILGDEPVVRVNRPYYRYVTHRFMNLHSIGYTLTDLASLLLLRRGYSPIHCSAFRTGASTVLVLAPPNTGKTLTTMMACIEHGAEYMAEDLAFTDGHTLYSVPWTSTFRYYSNIDESRRSRLMNALTRRIPAFELLPGAKRTPINEYVSDDRIISRSKITHAVILERGQTSIVEASEDEAFRKALNLNRYEFNYHKAPLAVAYEYFLPQLAIDDSYYAERRILREVMQNAAQRWIVRTADATRYAGMVLNALDGSGTQRPIPQVG